MNFLLDTHALIWAITDTGKLSDKVLDQLEDPNNSVFISAVTYWEIAVKFANKKLDIAGFSPQDLPELAINMGFISIPLTAIQTSTSHYLDPVFHKDPFDRMLIWQAIHQNLTLITKDSEIKKYVGSGLKILW